MYLRLGVEHILTGVDHLLFVLALLIVACGRRRLLASVTAFTAAHSITLALATLGFVRVPQQPVEAVIALSIVFVAVEIVRGRQGHAGIAGRSPWIVAFAFGLLHGFGFAGALSEIGLPPAHIPSVRRRGTGRRLVTPAPVDALFSMDRAGAALCHWHRGDVLGDPAPCRVLSGGQPLIKEIVE